MFRNLFALSSFVLITFLAGCKIDAPITVNVSGSVSGTTSLTCSAVPTASQVTSGQPASIQVSVSGGSGETFTISGVSGSFDASTTITRTYTSTSSSGTLIADAVTVIGSSGNSTTCNFSVDVVDSTSQGILSCQLTATPNSVNINNLITFKATGSGGSTPYTFSNLNLGSGGLITTALASSGTNSAQAQGSYSNTGANTAVVSVTDSTGLSKTCSATVTVASGPIVGITPSPASSVPVGSAITLTAATSGFQPAASSFVFSTTEPGVSVVSSGNTATVTAVDGNPHDAFVVSVIVSNSTQAASATTTLAFTGSSTLVCAISYPSGNYVPGNTVVFTATAASGAPLTITSASAQNGIVVSYSGDTANIKFTAAGTNNVSVYAQTSNGTLCNNGNALQTTVTVGSSGLASCSLSTSPSTSVLGQPFTATAVPNSNGSGNVQITSISISPAVNGGWATTGNGLSAVNYVYNSYVFNYYYAYGFTVTATLTDQTTGATAECFTQQIIRAF